MGITTAMVITAVVSAAVSMVGSVVLDELTGKNAAIKKQAKQAKEREELAQRQAQLQLARDKAALAKSARARSASMANAQASQGALFSSSAVGGQAAIASNLESALKFADATGTISAQDSAIKMSQIDTQADLSKTNHIAAGLQAGFSTFGDQLGEGLGKGIADWWSTTSANMQSGSIKYGASMMGD